MATPPLPSRAVASRQRSRNAGGMPRLAAGIPDIFIPLARNDVRNDVVFLTSSVPPTPPQIGGVESAARGDHRSGHAAPCHHGRARERIPLRHRSNLQRKKQHRHSGIFRVADLGPGTMPRGKYPESPAPAGSHALISRTPTPGGMLHANLGLPRPPPRNFQPPLPRFPSRLSPRRMSGTTVGRILSHPREWSCGAVSPRESV